MRSNTHISTSLIIDTVCNYYGVDIEHLKVKCRKRIYLYPRHLTMYGLRVFCRLSMSDIASFFGMDHTTVVSVMQTHFDNGAWEHNDDLKEAKLHLDSVVALVQKPKPEGLIKANFINEFDDNELREILLDYEQSARLEGTAKGIYLANKVKSFLLRNEI